MKSQAFETLIYRVIGLPLVGAASGWQNLT
jgi:hypothetical protein